MTGQEKYLARLYAEHQKLVKEINAGLRDDIPGNTSDEASDNEATLAFAIAGCPAETIKGVAMKLRTFAGGIWPLDSDLDIQDALVLAALADAERIAACEKHAEWLAEKEKAEIKARDKANEANEGA